MPPRAPSPSPAVAHSSAWALLVGTSRVAPPHCGLAFPPLLRPLLFSLLFLQATCGGAFARQQPPPASPPSPSIAVQVGAQFEASSLPPRPALEGVGFSISGFFSVYHAGVVHGLKAAGVISESTVFAGSSGGAHVGALHCSGVAPSAYVKAVKFSAAYCTSANNSCGFPGNGSALQTHSFDGLLPNNTWAACNDVLYVQMATKNLDSTTDNTPPCSTTIYAPKGGLVVSTFSSRDDLIGALVCAGYQPSQNPKCTCSYHGYDVIDAQYGVQLPCPPGAPSCCRVAAFPPSLWPAVGSTGFLDSRPIFKADIYPALSNNGTLPNTVPSLSNWLACANNGTLIYPYIDGLFALGAADAAFYLAANDSYSPPPPSPPPLPPLPPRPPSPPPPFPPPPPSLQSTSQNGTTGASITAAHRFVYWIWWYWVKHWRHQ